MSHECSSFFLLFQTQTADQNTTFEESEVLPHHDPFTIIIEGVIYSCIFSKQQEYGLSQYIAGETVKRTFITMPLLCNMVYDYCKMYNIARPPEWDLNQSADKEWFQGFMKRHSYFDWDTIFNINKCKILKPCSVVVEKSEFILVEVLPKEKNDDERSTLVYDIAQDHNYALSTTLQPS